MKQFRVFHSDESYSDLRSIFRYICINLWNHIAANNLYEKIEKRIDSLEFCPERFQLVDNDNPCLCGLRVTHVDNFNIYYRVDNEKEIVTIVRVLYCGVDLNNIASDNKKERS